MKWEDLKLWASIVALCAAGTAIGVAISLLVQAAGRSS